MTLRVINERHVFSIFWRYIMQIIVNLMDNCTVTLTKEGADIIKRQMHPDEQSKYYEGCKYSAKLWQLISIFGPYMKAGSFSPFLYHDIRVSPC